MVQASNEKVKDLSWQLELMVSIHPEIVQSTLTELEIPVGAGGNPAGAAKTILKYFIGFAFSGLTKFLTRLCDDRLPLVDVCQVALSDSSAFHLDKVNL